MHATVIFMLYSDGLMYGQANYQLIFIENKQMQNETKIYLV